MSEAVADEETTSMEADLEAAFDASEGEEEGTEKSGGSAEDTTESVGDTEQEGTEEIADEEAEEKQEAEAKEEDAEEEDGKESGEQTAKTKAPASWSPGNREHWDKLPAEVQTQVTKREREIESGLRDAAESRKSQDMFKLATEPFRDTINVEAGGDAILATRNLLNIATGLRVGAPPQKAQLAAQIIQSYGVDISMLDDILSGQIGPTGGQSQKPMGDPTNFRDPRVDQMLANQQQQKVAEDETIQQETEAFLNDPANEFALDLKDDMADLLEMAGRRGQELSNKQAYDKAIAMSSTIQKILASRSSDTKTSLKRKKRASRTIKGAPSGDGTQSGSTVNSMNQDISDAWDSAVGGEN